MQWLRNQLLSLNLQGMIVSNPVNIRYLTNIQAEGILLVTRKENLFITDSRYIEDVHNTLTLFDEIVVYDARGLTKEDYEKHRNDDWWIMALEAKEKGICDEII